MIRRSTTGGYQPRLPLLSWLLVLATLVGWVVVADGHWVRPGLSEPLDRPAPAFALRTFAGRTETLDELRLRPVVVNFWASWSAGSSTDAALLERAWRDARWRGIAFLGVAIHEQRVDGDPDYHPRTFVQRAELTYPIGHDRDAQIGARFGIASVPETYFIAPGGRIVRRVVGPLDDAMLRFSLEELLQEWAAAAPPREAPASATIRGIPGGRGSRVRKHARSVVAGRSQVVS